MLSIQAGFHARRCAVAGAILLLASCGGGGGGGSGGFFLPATSPAPPPAQEQPAAVKRTVGGTVTGLKGSLVLQSNAGDDIQLTADGTFGFATGIADRIGLRGQRAHPAAVAVLHRDQGQRHGCGRRRRRGRELRGGRGAGFDARRIRQPRLGRRQGHRGFVHRSLRHRRRQERRDCSCPTRATTACARSLPTATSPLSRATARGPRSTATARPLRSTT
jgi:hypothetical protein